MDLVNLVLCALLVMSNMFWLINTHKLLNKLMSRNYHEFKQAELKVEEKPATIKLPPDDIEDYGALHEVFR